MSCPSHSLYCVKRYIKLTLRSCLHNWINHKKGNFSVPFEYLSLWRNNSRFFKRTTCWFHCATKDFNIALWDGNILLRDPEGLDFHTWSIYLTTENVLRLSLHYRRIMIKNLHLDAKAFAVHERHLLLSTSRIL